MLSTDDPLVAIDVSKGKSHAQGFLSRGHPCGKPFSFAHTKAGFAKLGKLVSDLLGKAGKPPAVAYEHTGVYSRVVAGWAESSKLGSIPIPPLLSAKARKAKLRPTKTDAIDCQTIAEVAYAYDADGRRAASPLTAVSRRREDAAASAAAAKARYRREIDLCWPCLDQFIDPTSPAAIAAVTHYRHGAKRVESVLSKARRRFGRSSAKAIAESICSYAGESMSPVAEDSPEIKSLIAAAEALESSVAAEEELASELIAEARESGGFDILMSIDGIGIGERLAASILAELGDIARFRGRESIVAYAGLDPAVSQSGKSAGLHLHILRRAGPGGVPIREKRGPPPAHHQEGQRPAPQIPLPRDGRMLLARQVEPHKVLRRGEAKRRTSAKSRLGRRVPQDDRHNQVDAAERNPSRQSERRNLGDGGFRIA